MDLIDREALLKSGKMYSSYEIGVVKSAPAVSAKPLVNGEWIDTECGTLCSACHRVFDSDFEIKHWMCIQLKFCPDCGAKMRTRRH